MADLVVPNSIVDDTPIEALEHQQNYDAIESYINTEVIVRDGSRAMTGELLLVDGNQAASKTYVTNALADGIPIGTGAMWFTAVAPTKWLILDGSARSRSTYAALFALWGTTFGVGNGTTTFNLPNLKGRSPFGFDGGVSAFDTLGKTGGARDAIVVAHTHTVDVSHDHGSFVAATDNGGVDHHHAAAADTTVHFYDNNDTGHNVAGGAVNIFWRQASTVITGGASAFLHAHNITIDVPPLGATEKVTASSGGAATDANLPPYFAVHFIVKALP